MGIEKHNPFKEEISKMEVPVEGSLIEDLLEFEDDTVLYHEVDDSEEEPDEPDLCDIIHQTAGLWKSGQRF